MRAAAAALGADRPAVDGEVDWERVVRHQVEIYTIANDGRPSPPPPPPATASAPPRTDTTSSGRLAAALETFRKQPRPPSGLTEIALFAEGLAEAGDAEAAPYIRALGAAYPAEADAAAARLAFRRGLPAVAVEALVSAFTRYRIDPWPSQFAMGRGLLPGAADGRRPARRRRPPCTKRSRLRSRCARSTRSGGSRAC